MTQREKVATILAVIALVGACLAAGVFLYWVFNPTDVQVQEISTDTMDLFDPDEFEQMTPQELEAESRS